MSIRQKISLTILGVALITLATVGSAAPVSFYSITDLGTLPGTRVGIATGINKLGQVVGYSTTKEGSFFRAFFWEKGKMTDLGTLGGRSSVVYGGINNFGQVVGGSQTGEVTYDGFPVSHAFLWSKRVRMTDLTPNAGFLNTRAEKINDAGQVIGSTENGNAFRLKDRVKTDLCQLSQSCDAYDINNSGQVVGNLQVVVDTKCTHQDPDGKDCYDITVRRAYLWKNGEKINLGTIGNAQNSSSALAINDAGQIVGEADLHAVLWKNGVLTQLGTLGGRVSSALDINNLSQVVGRSATTSFDSDFHAFLWDSTKRMQDLNSLISANSGWLLSEARAINETGQIVGSGIIKGQEHAFLLTPKPVAKPTSRLGVLAFGAFAAGSLLLRNQIATLKNYLFRSELVADFPLNHLVGKVLAP